MNAMVLNTVYNHYLTSYAPKGASPYDTHKKSELRSIYNSMVKQNKDAPLFLLDTSKETQQFAVSIKEGARELRNTIASLGGLNENELLNKKIAYSSSPDLVDAKFVGDYEELKDAGDLEELPSFQIAVRKLALSQVNMGSPLPSDKMDLVPDTYSFDIGVNDLNYEFQFNVNAKDTNQDLQERLARLITNANIGVEASLVEDGEGNSSLRLESASTGLSDDKNSLFTVSDDNTSKSRGAVDYLGIKEISRRPSNSEFLLNGKERSTASNTFTIEKAYEITLNSVGSTEGEAATIGLKTDVDSLSENIGNLVGGYNDFMKTASAYLSSQSKAGRLVSEMQHISSHYGESLDSMGLHLNEEGLITVDGRQLKNSISSEDTRELFTSVKNFTGSLLRKSNQISLDPMNYAQKTVVAYKNPGKTFTSPYVASAYSGMMFNSYC